jgi:hypothetical protein
MRLFRIEAARAVLGHGHETLGLAGIHGLISPENRSSVCVLEQLDMRFGRTVATSQDGAKRALYSCATRPCGNGLIPPGAYGIALSADAATLTSHPE